jgi:glyoxylase-like metal-dependent hydrolase (beta-lactamase superfamily II)
VQRVELAPGVFHLQDGANMGLIVRDGKGLLIDAGLDKDAAKQVLRATRELDATLEGVFLTHAHADHFGGAHVLQSRLGVPLYAPSLEAAIMENPIIEPLYLFAGASAIRELRHKFTLAQPCRIDHRVEADVGDHPGELEIGPFGVQVVPLPGHALNQVGVAIDGVLFCADAVFPADTLRKHKVIFCTDMDETLATLDVLPTLPYARFAPGHGPAYRAGDEIARACAGNRERLEEIREHVHRALQEPQETSDLVERIADHLELRLTAATAYFLTQTTILAALSSLEQAGRARAVVENNRLRWHRT